MARKPEEIEGSRERAADRGQPQGLTFFESETEEGKRYLGDPADVEMTVREFAGEAHQIASDATFERITGEVAMDRLNALCDRYAGIFYGKEPGGFRAMPFNNPKSLGAFINERLGMTEPHDKAASVLFMNTANQIFEAYQGTMSGTLDDADAQFLIESAIDDTSRILLGLPPVNDEE